MGSKDVVTSASPTVGSRHLWENGRFVRLLVTRLSAQWGDGLFQAGLGTAVLFNPERAATPMAVALGFTVLLLPYSLVSPFAGALLDRWDRRRVLLWANVVRAVLVLCTALAVGLGASGVGLYVGALLVMAISRFVNAGLSAALPHVVSREHLVAANALATTLGTALSALGAASAIGLRAVFGAGNPGSGLVTACAVIGSVVSAVAAYGFARTVLGPDTVDEPDQTVTAIALGLRDGARASLRTPSVAAGFVALMAHRLAFSTSMLAVLLLMRYRFSGHGVGGVVGVGAAIGAVAAGMLIAAFVTPWLLNRVSRTRVMCWSLLVATIAQLMFAGFLTADSLLVNGLVIGATGQVIKLTVDASAQTDVGDEVRGRVFALYDTVFNISQVIAVLVAALLVAEDGYSPDLLFAVGGVYVLGIVGYLLVVRASAGRGIADRLSVSR